MAVFYDVGIAMRDGVRLSADIYLPDGEGPFPIILHRTPYNNNAREVVLDAQYFVHHGFAYVAQDCRGKFDSDGRWYPYRHEAEDGEDTLNWCGAQDWSSGRVGMTGASYCGVVQWYAASTANPYLKCIAPVVALSDLFFDHGLRRDGVFQPFYIHWTTAMAGRSFFDVSKAQKESAVWQVPLSRLDQYLGFDLPYWKDFVEHEAYDDFWRVLSVRDKYRLMDVPALNVGGWHSPWELKATLTHFIGMTQEAKSKEARERQKLIIGPWTHGGHYAHRVGDLDFGTESALDLHGLLLRWFLRWLKDEENGIDKEPPVRLFVMGANRWREEQEWPLRRAIPINFYLHGNGNANSLLGDGLLSLEHPTDEPPDRFTYNPHRPVESVLGEGGLEDEMFKDRRPIERRDDVLVYSTEPLADDLEVTGPIAVKLFASTSARDTDFMATLIDVHPDGYAKPLAFGIARGRYLAGFSDPRLLKPGQVYEWAIDLWATSNVFLRGHSIRLDVTSSFFPFFGRNHNTGNPTASDVEFNIAEQTLHHCARWPSHVVLQVVAGED